MEKDQLITRMLLNSWYAHVKAANKLFDNQTDEGMMREIAPGRNRMVYLLGHLAAVHDAMLPLLGFEEREYAHLDEAFLKNPDRTIAEIPSVAELRTAWTKTNQKLEGHFEKLSPAEWLMKHTAISDEDFAKEPHRNRLNVLISRTAHIAEHKGQMALLKN